MDKARTHRLERLTKAVETRLDHAPSALETLLSELKLGELHPELWEQLHAAAARDGMESELAHAYNQITLPRRLKQLPPANQAAILMQAANFLQGVLGDAEGAEEILERVLEAVPDHDEAFERLERRFTAAKDRPRLAELYAAAVGARKNPSVALVRHTMNTIGPLPAKTPLSAKGCRHLLSLLPDNLVILDVLDAHCRKTERFELACELFESAIADYELPDATVAEQRRRLAVLYTTQSDTPEKAVGHIEALLHDDPADSKARTAAEKLLSNREVGSRVAAALQDARRHSRRAPPLN